MIGTVLRVNTIFCINCQTTGLCYQVNLCYLLIYSAKYFCVIQPEIQIFNAGIGRSNRDLVLVRKLTPHKRI